MTFGQQIQSLRKAKGLSQDALAGMLYVTRQSVSQWENGKSMPSVDLLVRLSQIFGVSVDELLGNDNQTEQPTAEGKILTSKKELRLASSFKFASTASILTAIALSVVVMSVISSSIWAPAYRGIIYHVNFKNIIDDLIILSVSVILSVLFIVLRIIFKKRVTAFSRQISETIKFYSDRFVVTDSSGEPVTYFFTALRKVYENDNYLYLTLPTKQCIIVDKSSLSDAETVSTLLSSHNKYRKKRVVIKNKRQISPRAARLMITVNNLVFVLSMVLASCYLNIKAILLTNGGIPAPLRWLLFSVPIIAAIFSIVIGIIETTKHLKAKRLIFGGIGSLLFIGFLFIYTSVFFPAYNFNLRAVQPDEFLALMEENHFTVREANTSHLEDFLWECYEASDDNGINVTYLHFKEEVKNPAAYSAKTAYDGFITDERNAANNSFTDCYLNLYLNNYYTHYSENGRYCYISQNRYTVLYISAAADNKDKVTEIFSDYQMQLPY